jgi:hypothetical protein
MKDKREKREKRREEKRRDEKRDRQGSIVVCSFFLLFLYRKVSNPSRFDRCSEEQNKTEQNRTKKSQKEEEEENRKR